MFSYTFGRYYPVNSEFHKMNPFVKLICTFIFLVLVFSTNDQVVLMIFMITTVLTMLLTNVPLYYYLKVIYNLKILILFIVGINYYLGVPFDTTVIMVTKVILGVLYSMVFLFTTKLNDITYALNLLLKPLVIIRVPVKKIVFSISLALNFISTIFLQAEKILKSQASRGIDYRYSNIGGKITALSAMLTPMFVLTLRRADAIADAMEVRLYDYNTKRTSYIARTYHFFDLFMILIHLAIFVMAFWKEWLLSVI
ncbi:MAG: energy-coupling factor transporter transmembrane component T [Bacilli bacterium]|nr:energy-coupling factor transporter transmembrane component T [Bacilli bacterium]